MIYYKIQYGGGSDNNDIKSNIIDNLKNDVYCRIKRSKIHGVGVFAIKNIPKGINPFLNLKSKNKKEYIDINKYDLNDLSYEIIKMLDDYLGVNDDNTYSIPINGLNTLDISFFMNHSKNPNMSIKNDDDENLDDNFVNFISNKNINIGEELVIDYDRL
jgi:SET domain-containing protein